MNIVNEDAENAPVTTSRPNFKAMRIGMGLFILGLAIGLINGAIRDFGLFPEAYGKMIFLALIAVGMLTMGAGFVFPTKKYTKRKPSQSTAQSDPDVGLDTSPLAGELYSAPVHRNDIDLQKEARDYEKIAVGSVTDHTTRNLDSKGD